MRGTPLNQQCLICLFPGCAGEELVLHGEPAGEAEAAAE